MLRKDMAGHETVPSLVQLTAVSKDIAWECTKLSTGKTAAPDKRGAAWLLPCRIKRKKGVWWMPRQQEAMKDVIPCDKPWGAGNRL